MFGEVHLIMKVIELVEPSDQDQAQPLAPSSQLLQPPSRNEKPALHGLCLNLHV